MQQAGFVMLLVIIMLLIIAWPVQQLLQQNQFLLRQQTYRETQLQAKLHEAPLAEGEP